MQVSWWIYAYRENLNATLLAHSWNIKTLVLYNYRPIFTKESFYYERISQWHWTELATSYWTQWRGALCHILHTRRWHRTVNWHWEWPDPLQLDRTWEEQSVHQHCSAGCQLSWEVRKECSNSTIQPHTTRWVMMNNCEHCSSVAKWITCSKIQYFLIILCVDTTNTGPPSLPGPSSTTGNEMLHECCMLTAWSWYTVHTVAIGHLVSYALHNKQ